MAVAFFLPVYGRIVPIFIALMFLNWLIDGRFVKAFGQLFREKTRWQILSFALLYLLYLVGMSWSTNHDYGWFDLEVKLSLLIFPLIFSTLPLSSFTFRNRIMWSFVAGCVTGTLILLGHAAWMKFSENTLNAFYYIPLGWQFHPSYLSMYLNLAVGFLLIRYRDDDMESHRKPLILGLSLLLMGMIMLLSSKAGVLTLAAVMVVVAADSWTADRKLFPGLTFLGMLLLVFVLAYALAPYAFTRFSGVTPSLAKQQTELRVAPESNADRAAIWKSSLGIIRTNFLTGVGTGDVKDELLHSYTTGRIYPAYKLRMNAHSQYLQTFITLGVSGFLVLVLMILLPALRAFRRRDLVYLLFLFLFSFNILVESMLEEQAGVIFYAFFNIVLFSMQKKTRTQTFTKPPMLVPFDF